MQTTNHSQEKTQVSLSIIIPIYNVEKYIERCLESIISQDTSRYEIECVLINDCTPDNSITIARNIINNYHGNIQFRVLEHEKNKGLSEARNTGIRNATGENVLFIDSDDYLMPNSISALLEAKKQHPHADIIIGNVYEHRYKKNQYELKKQKFIAGGSEVRRWMLTNEFAISAWNKLFSRQFLLDNKLFFEPGILYEDIPWTYRLYTQVNSILLLPEVTYGYWYNEKSISSSSQPSDKAARSFSVVCQKLMEFTYERELYVPRSLFVFRWLLNGVNTKKNCSSIEIVNTLNSLRTTFMRSTLSDGRLILASFYLLMYKPFNNAFQIRFFRHYYNKISKAVEHTANLFDFLHHR